MLPFLKPKDQTVAGVIMKTRKPDEKPEENQQDKDDHSSAIESCAEELIRAIHSRDVKAAADAMKDAFEILDSMPHSEGPHYDELNEQAAKEE